MESTKDVFWACGLSPQDTAITIPEYYPGYNKLGAILEQVRSELLEEERRIAHISTDEPEAPETPKASAAPMHKMELMDRMQPMHQMHGIPKMPLILRLSPQMSQDAATSQ